VDLAVQEVVLPPDAEVQAHVEQAVATA